MEFSRKESKSPKEHITAIFNDYEASARVLQTLTNLSNTVIETALSGQCKFLFEILQNADDAFDDESKYRDIKLQLTVLDNYFLIQHNGKAFNYYDVERICDYASQIEEVKANDLSKTGYKGLGFKSLFNLSDCIYIYSNGYSFRFDKNYWPDAENKPWQVIPIWCDSLPLRERFSYNEPVNFIMKINDKDQLNIQLQELINHPEVLLYLHRVNIVLLNLNGTLHTLEKKVEKFGLFDKIDFLKNDCVVSTWLSKSFEQAVPIQLKQCIQEVSQFIYPDKIKSAKDVDFTFTLCISKTAEKVVKIRGFCYSTLPTQLQLSLPYHINSLFILNLDRTQFHENDWNEFLMYQIGYLQLKFLKDLAQLPHLKDFVIEILVRKINHPYNVFNRAFSKGFEEAKQQIAWLPAYKGHLLKLGEACIDKIRFFKQNFQNISDTRSGHIIDYDINQQHLLLKSEAERFDYDSLFSKFINTYYAQLTDSSYKNFLNYIYEISKEISLGSHVHSLSETHFLITKNKNLISPSKALLEEERSPIPDFAELNPVDNNYLPEEKKNSYKNWLVGLGAKRLDLPVNIIRESIFKWIDSNTLHYNMNSHNHTAIINYLAKNFEQFTYNESQVLRERLLILTKSNKFKIATSCYLPNAIVLEELEKIMPDDDIISSSYNINSLKYFFSHLEITNSLSGTKVFRKCILVWIKNGLMRSKLTIKNYKPIIEFLSTEYQKIEYLLKKEEKEQLKKMPILTCAGTFQEANTCCFDSASPEGFEDVIEKNKLVSTRDLNEVVCKFLVSIGVSKTIDPIYVIRNSVLTWIKNGTIQSRINLGNHHKILQYIAEHRGYFNFKPDESKKLRELPVLTKDNTFNKACVCYWQITSNCASQEKIPKIEYIVSDDELVSSEYYAHEKERPTEIERLLNYLGARYLKFDDIYHKYYDHLTDSESINWFFSNLVKHWNKKYPHVKDSQLLNNLKSKLHSLQTLSKNGKMYLITELYSTYFLHMYKLNKIAVPLLAFEDLPKELEKWLGIKQALELQCIMQLLDSVDKKQDLGEKETLAFFKTVLEQLRAKDRNEIRKYALKLLSKDNKLTPAKDLYYFTEEDAVCFADSFYLKRIHEMSHEDTLELAELCGVNILPFSQEINYGEGIPVCDKALREFYLERLPLIVLQEWKKLNESPHIVLRKLFCIVNSIELYKCQKIFVKYPFGKPVERRCHFEILKVFVVGNWVNLRTEIHNYLKEKLNIKSDINEILDMMSVSEDKHEWLHYQNHSPEKLLRIEEELNKLLSGEEIDDTADDSDEGSNENKLPINTDVDVGKINAARIEQCANSTRENIGRHDRLYQDNVGFKQVKIAVNHSKQDDDFTQLETKSVRKPNSSVCKNINNNNLFEEVGLEQVNITRVNQSANTGIVDNNSGDVLIQQDIPLLKNVDFELEKPSYDNTLKEFYIKILPLIVQWESKKQTDTPKKILKNLRSKISSIELYQCSNINIQYHCSYAAETYCFFDGLKIYVVGKWSDRKFKIHQYIKEQLGLHTDVADIINVEPVSQTASNVRSYIKKDDPEKFYKLEEEIETLVSKDIELPEKEEITAVVPLSGNSSDSCKYKKHLFSPHYSVKFKGSKALIIFTERTGIDEQHNPPSACSDEDVLKIGVKYTPRQLASNYTKRSKIPENHSVSINRYIEPERLSQGDVTNEFHLKRLSEKFVFIFLQDYYKNKYPDAQVISDNGHFTLQCELHTTEIIWLNEDEDKGLEYDLLLKRNEEVKQYIEVKSINEADVDYSNQIYSIFVRRNELAVKQAEYKENHYIYCVFYEVDTSTVFPEEMGNINALYKIVTLKNGSISEK